MNSGHNVRSSSVNELHPKRECGRGQAQPSRYPAILCTNRCNVERKGGGDTCTVHCMSGLQTFRNGKISGIVTRTFDKQDLECKQKNANKM